MSKINPRKAELEKIIAEAENELQKINSEELIGDVADMNKKYKGKWLHVHHEVQIICKDEYYFIKEVVRSTSVEYGFGTGDYKNGYECKVLKYTVSDNFRDVLKEETEVLVFEDYEIVENFEIQDIARSRIFYWENYYKKIATDIANTQ